MEKQNEKSLRYSWYVVFILMLAYVSSFIDRQILSLLVGPIKRDMHLSDTQMSLLIGLSFAAFYTFFGVFIGRLADKYNRRNIIISGILIWSVMTALCGGVKNYGQFFLVRMGVGVGEAALSPSAYSMISDYFPKDKLATALSTYMMGIFLGSGLAIVIGAGLIAGMPKTGMVHALLFGDVYPWQTLFLYIGVPGVALALWMLTIKEPARKETLQENGAAAYPTFSEAFQMIWRRRGAYIPICVGAAFTSFASYGLSAWIPTYFVRTFGWTIQKTGLGFGVVVMVFSALGVLAGGRIADRFSRKGDVTGKVRVGLLSGVGMFASCGFFLLSDPNWILVLLAIPAFFIALPLGSSAASVLEILPNRVRAIASSIYLFIINIIGLSLGPFVVAFCTDSIFHDEKMIKYSLIILLAIGGLATIASFWTGLKNYRSAITLNASAAA